VLTGCLDYIPPPEAITGEPNYYTCGIYQPPLADTMDYTVQDSTRACPDGSMPQLFEATWLDTDYDCPAIWGYVVDGSIRRRFACYTGTVDTAWPPVRRRRIPRTTTIRMMGKIAGGHCEI
jgi:hypothetical protein